MFEFAERFMTDMDVFMPIVSAGILLAISAIVFVVLAIKEWRRNK